jgi:hypothetical protein
MLVVRPKEERENFVPVLLEFLNPGSLAVSAAARVMRKPLARQAVPTTVGTTGQRGHPGQMPAGP